MIQFEEHIFKYGLKPPTRWPWRWFWRPNFWVVSRFTFFLWNGWWCCEIRLRYPPKMLQMLENDRRSYEPQVVCRILVINKSKKTPINQYSWLEIPPHLDCICHGIWWHFCGDGNMAKFAVAMLVYRSVMRAWVFFPLSFFFLSFEGTLRKINQKSWIILLGAWTIGHLLTSCQMEMAGWVYLASTPSDTHRPSRITPNLPLTFQDTQNQWDFHPKLPPGDWGVFLFQQFFFSKRNCSTPKMTKIPERFWRFWRMALGDWDWRLCRRSKRKKSGWRGCRWEKNMSSSLAIDEKLQWNKYVKTPRIARMSHWKISCNIGFSSRTTFSLPKALLKMMFFFLR